MTRAGQPLQGWAEVSRPKMQSFAGPGTSAQPTPDISGDHSHIGTQPTTKKAANGCLFRAGQAEIHYLDKP